MTAAAPTSASFNLWSVPWIDVELLPSDDSALLTHERLSISACLQEAHRIASFTDESPLVVASLQRYLTAIAQAVVGMPSSVDKIDALLEVGQFDAAQIAAFGERYAHRFDLFDAAQPFLQSGDIGLEPVRGMSLKPMGYLFPEVPTATNINHFAHRFDADYQVSPASAALGLITFSAFANSGGAGIKPSINGVPPIYVLPVGRNLFETLVLSMIVPKHQPKVADTSDRPAWERDAVVERSSERRTVGYLESLTFPARRVRLIPNLTGGIDSRTGEWSDIIIRRMVFEQGFSRAKDGEAWRDPFVAYRVRPEGPLSVRPLAGKTLWREYGTLFLTRIPPNEQTSIPPSVIEQLAELSHFDPHADNAERARLVFRCIGMRIENTSKVCEWVDDTLDVPQILLGDIVGLQTISEGINRADAWDQQLWLIHRRHFEDAATERRHMRTNYWIFLATEFPKFVEDTAHAQAMSDVDAADDARVKALRRWCECLFNVGDEVLEQACDSAGDAGEHLIQRAEALAAMAKQKATRGWLA